MAQQDTMLLFLIVFFFVSFFCKIYFYFWKHAFARAYHVRQLRAYQGLNLMPFFFQRFAQFYFLDLVEGNSVSNFSVNWYVLYYCVLLFQLI